MPPWLLCGESYCAGAERTTDQEVIQVYKERGKEQEGRKKVFHSNEAENLNIYTRPSAPGKELEWEADRSKGKTKVLGGKTVMKMTWNWMMEQKSLEPMEHIKTCQLRWKKLDFLQVELELSACMPVFTNTRFNE